MTKPRPAVRREMSLNEARVLGWEAFLAGVSFDACPYRPTKGSHSQYGRWRAAWEEASEMTRGVALKVGRDLRQFYNRSYQQWLPVAEKPLARLPVGEAVVTSVRVARRCDCGEVLLFAADIEGDQATEGFNTCKCGQEYRVTLRPSRVEPTGARRAL